MYTQWGIGSPYGPAPVERDIKPPKPAASPSERLLDVLYTHSPSGAGQLALMLGFDPRAALAELASAGKVVYRQIGDVVVWSLVGAMGA